MGRTEGISMEVSRALFCPVFAIVQLRMITLAASRPLMCVGCRNAAGASRPADDLVLAEACELHNSTALL